MHHNAVGYTNRSATFVYLFRGSFVRFSLNTFVLSDAVPRLLWLDRHDISLGRHIMTIGVVWRHLCHKTSHFCRCYNNHILFCYQATTRPISTGIGDVYHPGVFPGHSAWSTLRGRVHWVLVMVSATTGEKWWVLHSSRPRPGLLEYWLSVKGTGC